jgi:hypothetical protein
LAACGGGGNTTLGPQVVKTDPGNEAGNVPVETSIRATFSSEVDPVTVNSETFIISGDVRGTVQYQDRTAIFTPSLETPLKKGTKYYIVLTTGIKDLDGIPLPSNFNWSFETDQPDKEPPKITVKNPKANATAVPTNRSVSVTFDEAIDPASFPSRFLLKGPNGVLVESTMEIAPATMTLKPIADLDFDTSYDVLLLKGIKDLSGNETLSNVSWRFKTGNEPDQTLPAITDRTPKEGGEKFPVRGLIKVTFSEPMNESSITARDHFIVSLIRGDQTERVKGAVKYEAATLTATFTSSERLEYDARYQVLLDPLIQDAAGNPLGDAQGNPLQSPEIWFFTTAALAEPAPEVTSTDPAHGATGISVLIGRVVASFRQPIDPTTLPGRYTLKDASGSAIPGSVGLSVGAQAIFSFSPGSALLYNTWYRAALEEGILSASGAASTSQSYFWCFRTEPDPDIVEPEAAPPEGCARPGP